MQYTADESIITRSQLLKLPHCPAISSGIEVNFITAVTLSTTAIQFRLLPKITASPILSLIPLDLLQRQTYQLKPQPKLFVGLHFSVNSI
jgi:hypothetical protein